MTTTYNKSVTTDFSGSTPNLDKFHSEIVGGISGLQGITMTGDSVDIIFDAALSEGEQTTLNNLIAAHDNIIVKNKINFYTIYPKNSSVKALSYITSAVFKYGGSDNIGIIDYIEILAYKDSNITSYSARIYSKTSGLVIAEKTGITNDTDAIVDLGTISNIPVQQEIFELQIKKTGGNGNNNVYIDSIIIYHGN